MPICHCGKWTDVDRGEVWTDKEGKIVGKWAPHYSVIDFDSFDVVRKIFPEGKADELNWLFCSTSGVHGSYVTLDELEEEWDNRDEGGNVFHDVTILILHPRLCVIRCGDVEIQREDIPFLRMLVTSTIDAITKSQDGNKAG